MFKFSLDLLELKVGRPLLPQLLQGGVDLLVEDVVDLLQPGNSVLNIIMINFLGSCVTVSIAMFWTLILKFVRQIFDFYLASFFSMVFSACCFFASYILVPAASSIMERISGGFMLSTWGRYKCSKLLCSEKI